MESVLPLFPVPVAWPLIGDHPTSVVQLWETATQKKCSDDPRSMAKKTIQFLDSCKTHQ